jgi:hypothetical protein
MECQAKERDSMAKRQQPSIWDWQQPHRKHVRGVVFVKPLPGSLMERLMNETMEEQDERLAKIEQRRK